MNMNMNMNINSANSLLMEQQIKNNMIEEIYNYDFKTVCTKEQVYLKREKSCNIFLLQFNLENKKKNLHDIINLNMYDLLFNLNKANFEKIEIKKWISPNEIEVLFLFKPFGKELGIKPKYMYIRTIANITNEKHIYTSVDIDYPYAEELQNYEKVKNIISTMIINFESNHKININYIFKFELAHTLPIYMENILGLIMKKMFLHLKQFIEIA
uniref:Coenzyme Q-binding protein COQ10 START domain-containing protein n=1 Tax=viral metagenome TaxID=1070528 RepID=A0A6C0EYV0_9ZZZZ